MQRIVKILLPLPFDKDFDYSIPEEMIIDIHDYAYVPFGKKKIWGVVTDIKEGSSFKGKLKPIITSQISEDLNIPPIRKELLELINWQSEYTMEERGKVLSLCYHQKFFKKITRTQKTNKNTKLVKYTSPIELNMEQKDIVENILPYVKNPDFSVHLLDGVTGSGKTEIYLELIDEVLKRGEQSLVLLPEILLTSQMVERFEAKFGFIPCIWHSSTTEAQKRNNFKKIASGEIKIVLGARSALHLPYSCLSLIILDEEHDTSYKQEDSVIYNARDIAIIRANIEKIPIILCSATPSIETYYNSITGKYNYHKIVSRFNDATLPEIRIIDMREEKLNASKFISEQLKSEIEENLKNNNQTLLFLNRKGYAPLTLCGNCGFRFKSPDTSAWMVMHYDNLKNPYLECHHSGLRIKLPKNCPKCESENSFRACGPGVQRIAEEVAQIFPEARILEVSKDSVTDPKKSKEMIQKITEGKVDIIIGTQIIAKGYHFPALKLVGVIDGDLGLDFSDLRASERTFQLLQQVSGRAGREGDKGKVLIQTYQADNEIFNFLKNNDRDNFLKFELEERKKSHLPPFSRLVAIIIESKNEQHSSDFAKLVTSKLAGSDAISVYGPAKALYYELRGYYRNRILLKADKKINIQKFISECLKDVKTPSGVKLKIDVDPYSFG